MVYSGTRVRDNVPVRITLVSKRNGCLQILLYQSETFVCYEIAQKLALNIEKRGALVNHLSLIF